MKTSWTLIFYLLMGPVFGQTLSGRITDIKGKGIAQVVVSNGNSDRHAHCDENGNFWMEGCKAGDTLVFYHMVYEADPIVLTGIDQPIEVVMKDRNFLLDRVEIHQSKEVAALVSKIDLVHQPVQNAQQLMRMVPGLFIGQHAGGGKAEQIFLRGFDIDHGTDLNLSVDGIPVNMVSHAHGQGYADLHFVIPETLNDISYGKGPYDVSKGNFATAGHISFTTKEKLDKNQLTVEAGQFNSYRAMTMLNVTENENSNAYVAADYNATDGPFDSPQGFHRINLFGKYNQKLGNLDKITVQASHFQSQWDASGQIPQRAVDAGLIGRFGAIDKTEGGQTSRSNFSMTHTKYLSTRSSVKSQVYYSRYNFELYSNFTLFLRDSIHGDQIRQKENRDLFGIDVQYIKDQSLGSGILSLKVLGGLRHDNVKGDELSHTYQRKNTLETVALGDVDESNFYLGAQAGYEIGKLSIQGGFRIDRLLFNYRDAVPANYVLNQGEKSRISPKINLQYDISNQVKCYLKAGRGFHSNDARVTLSGQVANAMPVATGADLGMVSKVWKKLVVTAALWYLKLDQEFVYVGDEGIIEPSGRTERKGIDLGLRYQPFSTLFLFADYNTCKAISVDDEIGNNFIPLAPTTTLTGGVNAQLTNNLGFGARFRHMRDRAANEDYSITAAGYTVVDVNLLYQMKNMSFGVDINNVLNTSWNETQFATESRLQNEASPVEEIHFTPGFPFMARAKMTFNW
ncbi:MAG: TonB-dependent receptor [Saprospiraceae bacterium]|nr:TonB-dependent receptor [Saprospiraceae bacterium]